MSDRYGCHNHPLRRNGWSNVPNGWTHDGTRKYKKIMTQFMESRQCGHDLSDKDPRCEGCRWRGWEEKELEQ